MDVLSVDFDYWYAGDFNIKEYADEKPASMHCGRCRRFRSFPHNLRLRPTVLQGDIYCESDSGRIFSLHRESNLLIKVDDVLSKVTPGTTVFITECHADLVPILWQIVKEHKIIDTSEMLDVAYVDYHDDSSDYVYGFSRLNCGSWVKIARDDIGHEANIRVKRIDLKKGFSSYCPGGVRYLHICKSSQYMVRRGDKAFKDFVDRVASIAKWRPMIRGFRARELREFLKGEKT
jgi:hypothetical protein